MGAAATAAHAATATNAAYDDWSDASGADPVATIADLSVSRDAITPGSSAVAFSLRSLRAQRLRIVVVNARGTLLRTVVDADVAAAALEYQWDGTSDAGDVVPDGSYEVVVEADDGHESMSVSDQVRVDRRAPTVTVTASRLAVAAHASSVAVPLFVSEPAMLDVAASGRVARTRSTTERRAGRQRLVLPLLGSAARRSARGAARSTVAIRIAATDAAGNRSVVSVAVPIEFTELTTTPVDDGGTTDPGNGGGSSTITWPLSGPLTSRFGMRWGRMHNGIDIGVPTGRRIGAAAPGTVTYAGWMSGYGNTVIIDHGRLDTLYGHQSRIATHVGQHVARGQTVGFVGSTGNSTGPHLHFEVRVGGAAKDPLTYLP